MEHATDKDVETYAAVDYPIELTRNADGSFYVKIPDLPGCASEGETADEAVEMIEDAKVAWIEVALERGLPIPAPSTEERFSGKFVVRVGKSLHRELSRLAKEEGLSLNALVVSGLSAVTTGEIGFFRQGAADAYPRAGDQVVSAYSESETEEYGAHLKVIDGGLKQVG